MKSIVLILECLTNLHVGNGDVNYNVVDNEVERDPVTNYPTINSSGVKGALRAFLEDNENVDKWFGGEGEKGDGKIKVLSANLIAMPARATAGPEAFYLLTTNEMIKLYNKLGEAFSFDCNGVAISKPVENSNVNAEKKAEDILLKNYIKFNDKEIYVVEDEDFRKIDLPVIARNRINGDRNLWYEEVVSHESIFYIPIISEDNKLLEAFKEAVNGKVIQFGGNASIGYGLCKVIAR